MDLDHALIKMFSLIIYLHLILDRFIWDLWVQPSVNIPIRIGNLSFLPLKNLSYTSDHTSKQH